MIRLIHCSIRARADTPLWIQARAFERFVDIAEDRTGFVERDRPVTQHGNPAERIVREHLGRVRRQRLQRVGHAFFFERHADRAAVAAARVADHGQGAGTAFRVQQIVEPVEHRLPAAHVRIAGLRIREAGMTHVQIRAAVPLGERDFDQRLEFRRHRAGLPCPRVGKEVRAVDLLILAAGDVPAAVTPAHHDAVLAADPRVGAHVHHVHAARAVPGGKRLLVGECVEDLLAWRTYVAVHFQVKRRSLNHGFFRPGLVALPAVSAA